ncbi:hypothetical protein WR25_15389 [Diploscapter pachys]|uniref:Uncharacterized protein n=1 Tax=Diploscapter pachys TaxID=2018661 RepID=A0A2A2LK05_9BILA|nr:hypothetical protein WR25_15389 [Diploscapter pachys]
MVQTIQEAAGEKQESTGTMSDAQSKNGENAPGPGTASETCGTKQGRFEGKSSDVNLIYRILDNPNSFANKRDYIGLPDGTNAVCAHGGRHLYGLAREPSRRMHRYQCGWQKQVRKLGRTRKFLTFGNMTFDTACQGKHRRRGKMCQVVISLPAKKEKESQG